MTQGDKFYKIKREHIPSELRVNPNLGWELAISSREIIGLLFVCFLMLGQHPMND